MYQFDNGLFRAHPQYEDDYFHKASTLKVLPTDAVVIEVNDEEDHLEMSRGEEDILPSWTKVTEAEEIEGWPFRRNTAHHTSPASASRC